MYFFLEAIIVTILLSACCSSKQLSVEQDSLLQYRIERAEGVNVSNSFVKNDRTVDRFQLIVLNEKGDTVRQRDSIRIVDSRVEVYKDSIHRMQMEIDSLRASKNKVITNTIVKTPWYATKDWLLIFLFLSFIPGVIIGKKIAR